jgi:hypothetical protein
LTGRAALKKQMNGSEQRNSDANKPGFALGAATSRLKSTSYTDPSGHVLIVTGPEVPSHLSNDAAGSLVQKRRELQGITTQISYPDEEAK